MATDLSIRISAELTEVKAALAGLQTQLRQVGQAANAAGNSNGIDKLNKSLGGALGAVRNLVGGFAAFAGLTQIIKAADELTALNARLKLVTNSQEQFNRAQVALFDLAQRTRSSLGETVDLYTRIAQSTKDAGIGQETLLQVVETINQAVQLSGASAQAANAALVQLGQGLGSGTLRGEELNSVLEQTPALADAIAKGMGITRGELRKYGEEGKITGEAVIAALQKQRDEVAKNFESLPLTVGQSITRLGNSLTQLIGVFDQATSGTGGLAAVLNDLASFLSSDEFVGGVAEFANAWGSAFKDIVGDAKAAIQAIRDATRNFLGDGNDIFTFLFNAIRDLPRNLRTVVRIAAVTFAGMVDSFIADAQLLRDAFIAIFTDDTIEAAIARRNRTVNAAADAVKEQIDEIVADGEKAKAEAKKAADEVVKLRQAGRVAGDNTAGPNRTKALRPVLDTFALTKDAADRGIKEIEALYKAAEVSLANYLETRTRLQLTAIDAEIAAEQKKLAEAVKARKQDEANKAATKIETLQRDRGSAVAEAERTRVQEQQQINSQLVQLEAQRLEQQGKLEEAALLRLQEQYREFRKRLVTEGNTQGVSLIDSLISTEAARAKFAEIQKQAEQVQQRLQSRLQSLADQRSTGGISGDAAASGQREARQQATEELTALNAQLGELATRTNDPEIVRGAQQLTEALAGIKRDGLEGTDLAIANLIASLDQMRASLASTIADKAVDALSDLFTSLGDDSKSAGEKVKDFVRSFAQSMAQLAARALATYIVLQTLDAIYPGLGRAAAAGMSVASKQHTGGMAGTGQKVSAPAWLFAGAPRYHSGGMVGLKSDEVPAILQRGEEVLSRNDPRNQANGGGSVRVVNAVDPNLVGDYMNSSGGERTIVNLIQRNAGQIKQVLG